MGPISRLVRAAALSCAATLALAWPTATMADGEEDPRRGVTLMGEIVEDHQAKTGWVIEVEADNAGDEAQTAAVETVVNRQIMNASARVGPVPTAMWRKKGELTVPAHGQAKCRYDVPASLAEYMTNVAAAGRAAAARNVVQQRVTVFSVAFKGAWADETWTDRASYAAGRYGDSMPTF